MRSCLKGGLTPLARGEAIPPTASSSLPRATRGGGPPDGPLASPCGSLGRGPANRARGAARGSAPPADPGPTAQGHRDPLAAAAGPLGRGRYVQVSRGTARWYRSPQPPPAHPVGGGAPSRCATPLGRFARCVQTTSRARSCRGCSRAGASRRRASNAGLTWAWRARVKGRTSRSSGSRQVGWACRRS